MSNLQRLPERMLDLATQAGDRISDLAPRASDWLDAGAKLGALKGASKIGLKVVKRNPVVFGAAIAGAGLLWYAARRRAKRAEAAGNGQTVEGSARRIDARNGDREAAASRKTTRRASTARRSTRTANRESRTEH